MDSFPHRGISPDLSRNHRCNESIMFDGISVRFARDAATVSWFGASINQHFYGYLSLYE